MFNAIALKNNTKRQNRYKTFFSVLLKVLALVLLVVGSFEYVPVLVFHDPLESIHIWHISELGALAGILLGSTLFILSYKVKEWPMLAQFFIVSMTAIALGVFPFDHKAAGLLAVVALFIALYPAKRALLSFTREARPSIALFALTALFASLLLPIAWRDLHYQITGMLVDDPHALKMHWIGSALMIVLLIVAGALAATKRPGWKVLGFIVGESYVFLGVVAMLVPDYPGSWGIGGGFLSAVGGVLYILLTMASAEAQKEREEATTPAPALAIAVPESIVTQPGRKTIPLDDWFVTEVREAQPAERELAKIR